MKYANGFEIRLGDCVRIFNMQTGVVVFSVDTDEYSDAFPKNEWAYLKSGVMVKTAEGALVHIDDSNANAITRMAVPGNGSA